jgi:hypothetical protein
MMTGAIKSMNNCVRGYLHLNEKGGIIIYNDIEDDASFEGNTEEYINKLEFKEGEELDLQQEWDNFCDDFFNNWINTGNNFYRDVDDWADLSEEFNSKEMLWLLSETNKYWLDTVGDPLDTEMFEDEERTWNNIAYFWIRERSDIIKEFVLKKIQEKFDDWLEEQKEDGNYPLTCDICYRNKQICSYAACCNDKKFCGGCYKKIKKVEGCKVCPYCRGKLDHVSGEEDICNQTGFQDWLYKTSKMKPFIENKVINNCVRCNVEIRYRNTFRIINNDLVCEKCIATPSVIIKERKRVVRRKQEVVIETPFETWRRQMNNLQCELLYKAGRCYEHHQDCECHLEKDCEM